MESRDDRAWTTPTLTHLSISLDTAISKLGSGADGNSPGTKLPG